MVTLTRTQPALSSAAELLPYRGPHPELRALGLLLLWSVVLFWYGIHTGELYRTEGLRTILAAEMLKTGHWLVPTLYGEPLLTKPPLHYWTTALFSLPGGQVTPLTARLPSALGGTIMVLALYWLARRHAGRQEALTLALLAPCAVMWLDKASAAELDMYLVGWVTLSIACFSRAVEHRDGRLGWWLAALLSCAAGVLTKWTAFLFLYACAVPFLAWRGHWRLFFSWKHGIAAAVGAGVCCLWVGAVVQSVGWDTVWGQMSREAAPRLLHSENLSQHPVLDTVLHPLKLVAINLPWSAAALAVCFPASWRHLDPRGKRLQQLLACWAVGGMVLMSLFPDHNTRHSFPVCPALTGLGGWILARQRLRRSTLLAILLLVWFAIKMVYVEMVVPRRDVARQSPAKAAVLAAHVPQEATLYLNGVKDEGIMYYYGRPVRRIRDWSRLPATGAWVVLKEGERPGLLASGRWLVSRSVVFADAQGDRLELVKLETAK